MKTVADVIKNAPKAVFFKFRNGVLYYDANGFIIRIPADELGDAHVMGIERTATFMKWIAKELQNTNTDTEAA